MKIWIKQKDTDIPIWIVRLIIFLIMVLFLFSLTYVSYAGPIVWDYSINDYTTLPDCPRVRMLNDEFYALQELYTKPARRPNVKCYYEWDLFIWENYELAKAALKDRTMQGWEVHEIIDHYKSRRHYAIWLKKQICTEGK
uniref:Uncharacterized protein n=1 Tax=viral metagenome TaxID=1070528 RepID=A0A6M3JQU5_9ZZZZ